MMGCAHCGDNTPLTTHHDFFGGGQLCRECARLQILGWLDDCDSDQLRKLRCRAEERLRKSPRVLRNVLTELIIEGSIKWEDQI